MEHNYVTVAVCIELCVVVWARERCRISPPRFLAECCKRQLNEGSFVLLYFRLFTFFQICIEFICIFVYCFVCQYQSSDWLRRPPPT